MSSLLLPLNVRIHAQSTLITPMRVLSSIASCLLGKISLWFTDFSPYINVPFHVCECHSRYIHTSPHLCIWMPFQIHSYAPKCRAYSSHVHSMMPMRMPPSSWLTKSLLPTGRLSSKRLTYNNILTTSGAGSTPAQPSHSRIPPSK